MIRALYVSASVVAALLAPIAIAEAAASAWADSLASLTIALLCAASARFARASEVPQGS